MPNNGQQFEPITAEPEDACVFDEAAPDLEPDPPPEVEAPPCAPPVVRGLSSTQAIFALEECYAAIGKAARNGYHVDGKQVAALIGQAGILIVHTPKTSTVGVAAGETVDGQGAASSVATLPTFWSVVAPLLARPVDRCLDLLAARCVLECASSQAVDWAHTNNEGAGIGAHISGALGL